MPSSGRPGVLQSNDVNPADPFHKIDDLFAISRRHLVDFLETEIQLGFTFLDLAATARDLGHLAHFEQAKKDAKGCRHHLTLSGSGGKRGNPRRDSAALQRIGGRVSRSLASCPAPLAEELDFGGWPGMLEHILDGLSRTAPD